MSEAYNLLRAKSIKDEQIEDSNLLLKDHILETLGRLVTLYSYTEKNKEQISNQWFKEGKKKGALFTSLAKALFIHDLGKIGVGFQRQLFNQKKDDEDKWEQLRLLFNWDKYPKQSIKRHEYISLFWSYFLLDDERDHEWAGKIRTAILFHHYNQFYTNAEKEILEIIRENRESSIRYLSFLSTHKNLLEQFLKSLIKEVEEKYGQNLFLKKARQELQARISLDGILEFKEEIEQQSPDISVEIYDPEISSEEEQELFLLMSGILKRCDHSASAEIKVETTDNLESFFLDIARNIENAIKKDVQKDSLWQKSLLAETNENYPLLIAPTGSGKTEFALLWAAKQKRKLIYTLPLRVALNDLFSRFKEYAIKRKENVQHNDEENVVSLLHSTAFIEYVEEEQRGKGISIDRKISSSKNFASPLILTTPDQVFLTALNFYGSDKLKSIYPLSAIVIDEIQAYDPEMAAIIVKSIADIQSIGGNILIMTATYPPYFREFFTPSREENKILPKSFSCIKLQDYNSKIKNYNVKRHKIKLIDASFGEKKEQKSKNEDETKTRFVFEVSKDLQDKVEEQIANTDNNILIICNTVSKAIEVYNFIEEKYQEKEKKLYLLHSRLVECVKNRRVKEIKEEIKNKHESKNFERIILVATQIVEASVDVDFDVLITEASPIDSQIQRWGRVFRNRYDEDKNPLDYDKNESNIILFKKIDDITKRIYDSKTVEKTVEYLTEIEANLSKALNYEDEKALVEQTFEKKLEDEGITLKEKYEGTIRDLFNKLKYFSIEKRSEAQRVFRKIAGLTFVFPNLMEIDEQVKDESKKTQEIKLRKLFAEIVRKQEYKDFTWKDIIQKIKEETSFDEDDKKLQWNLRKLLNEYSINIPIYFIENQQEKRGVYLLGHEFKGFYVWKLKNERVGEILKKGIDISEPKIDEYLLEENIL